MGIKSTRMSLGLCFVLSWSTLPALAQTEQTAAVTESTETRTIARRMADEAANLYEAGKYEEARDLFHRANQLYPAPVLELWEARALEKLGRLVEAEERYASVQRYKIKPEDTDVVRAAVRDAGIEIELLRRRIPTITITLRSTKPSDPALEVHLDGKRLNPALIGFPIPVDVGSRNVKLIVRGKETLRIGLTVVEGDRKPIELDPDANSPQLPGNNAAAGPQEPRDTPTPSAAQTRDRPTPWYMKSTVGWLGASLGVAGLAVGAATGLVASTKHGSLAKHCPNNACLPEYGEDLDSFRTYRTISTVGYSVGGLALAAGVTILVLAPHETRTPGTPALALRLGTSAMSLVGRF